MPAKLTEKVVAEAICPPGAKDRLHFDSDLKGFALRVTQSGGKTFLFQYNVPDGKRRIVLGTYGTELTVSQARRKAESLRGQVRDGRDPVAERRMVRIANAAAATAAAFTVERLISEWAAHLLSARSASYSARVPRELRRALANWLSMPATNFTRQDAAGVLDRSKATCRATRQTGPLTT